MSVPAAHRLTRTAPPLTAGLAVAAILAFAPGCSQDEVKHFRVPKEAPAPSSAMPAGMGGMGGAMGGDVAPPPAPQGGVLRWTLPKGWTEEQGGGAMRFATLKPNVPGKLDVTVVVLPGPAGGELANVNRWRNQIGLPPIDEQALGASRKPVKTRAGEVSLYDFTSEGEKKSRTVAGFTVSEGNTWFVKLSGDAEAVAAARPAFVNLVESLRFDAANP